MLHSHHAHGHEHLVSVIHPVHNGDAVDLELPTACGKADGQLASIVSIVTCATTGPVSHISSHIPCLTCLVCWALATPPFGACRWAVHRHSVCCEVPSSEENGRGSSAPAHTWLHGSEAYMTGCVTRTGCCAASCILCSHAGRS